MAAAVLAAQSPRMVSRIRLHPGVMAALPYRFPQLLDTSMQGNNADRDLAERGIENSKKKEEIERKRRGENTDDGKPIPVSPGLVETPPKK
jgi:hypothetical protein